MKVQSKTLSTNRSRKNVESDTKKVPKWNPGQCKKPSKSHAKTSIEKYHENHRNRVSLNGKIIQIHLKTNMFEDLAGCVRERKRYQPKHPK